MGYPTFVGFTQIPVLISSLTDKAEILRTKYLPVALRHIRFVSNAYLALAGLKEIFYNRPHRQFNTNPHPSISFQAFFSNQHYYLVHGITSTLAGGFGIFLNLHDYDLFNLARAYTPLSLVAGGFFLLANAVAFNHYKKIYCFVRDNHNYLDEAQKKGNNAIKYSSLMGLISCSAYFVQASLYLANFPSVGLGLGFFALSLGVGKFFYDISFVSDYELPEVVL